jgi:hypothetical protein
LGSRGEAHYIAYLYDGGQQPHLGTALVLMPFVGINETLGLPFAIYSGNPCVAYGPKYRPTCERDMRHEIWRVVVGYDDAWKVVEIEVPERIQ